ncbi:MAG: glutathione S-transferase family protein [Pseudomonadota bacterium]
MTKRFQIYVSSISYYSGKFEAYLRYVGLPHDRIELTVSTFQGLLQSTGVKKMPAAQCPDGRWLKDTTPMIDYLDREHAQVTVYPDDPVERFLGLLLEDYADEWLWRPAMHYRWSYPDSRAHLARRIESLMLRLPLFLKPFGRLYIAQRQLQIYIRGDGVRRANREAIEAIYHRTLQALDALLQTQDYLGGDRPSIVDFGFYASMWRHFALDPDPAAIMRETAPNVYAWVARVWAARADEIGERSFQTVSSAAWKPVWRDLLAGYLPYLDQNAQAYRKGQARFDALVDGVFYPRLPVVRYRVACREQLLLAWHRLSGEQQAQIGSLLDEPGITEWFVAAEAIPSGLDEEFNMPLQERYRAPSGVYGLKTLNGTPWDMHKDAVKR